MECLVKVVIMTTYPSSVYEENQGQKTSNYTKQGNKNYSLRKLILFWMILHGSHFVNNLIFKIYFLMSGDLTTLYSI